MSNVVKMHSKVDKIYLGALFPCDFDSIEKLYAITKSLEMPKYVHLNDALDNILFSLKELCFFGR
jgi:hypothetical protein